MGIAVRRGSDSWGGQHETETAIQLGVSSDESPRFPPQPRDAELEIIQGCCSSLITNLS